MFKLFNYCLIFLYLFLILSCKNEKVKIIPQETLIHILADIQLTEAALEVTGTTKIEKYSSIFFQDSIFAKYGYTSADFDSTLSYYSKRVEEFNKINDEIVELLKLASSSLEIEKSNNKNEGQENIWNMKRNWKLPEDGVQESVSFKVPLEGPGKYTLKYEVIVYSDDESINPRSLVYFFKEDSLNKFGKREYFLNQSLNKDDQFETILVEKELKDTTFKYLKGELLNHTFNKNKYWKKHMEIKNISLYYMPVLVK